jgi:O-antigen/teichoic acid export membrane protein
VAFNVANQINSHVISFANSIGQASIPQITKSYSGGDSDRSNNIVYAISRYTFLMMFIISVPLLLSLDFILDLWLDEVPQYTYQFTFLMIINGLVNCLASGTFSIISASGKIRMPQIFSSIILLLTLPLSIIAFYLKFEPYVLTVITIVSSIANIYCFVYYAHKLGNFNYVKYIKDTLIPIFKVVLFVLPLFVINYFLPTAWYYSVVVICVSFIFVLVDIYFVGFNCAEREIVKNILLKIIRRII